MNEEHRMFAKEELLIQLEEIGSILKKKVCLYLIGGCAMILHGSKVATKDIDAVLLSSEELVNVMNAMKSVGYADDTVLPRAYKQLGASAVLRNSKQMRFDLYCKQVCNGLEISNAMTKRARLYFHKGNLLVYLMAPEDIFLFKSITERVADLGDMAIMARKGVDWDVILEECAIQEKRRNWLSFLYMRLLELRKEHGIEPPILRRLRKDAEDDLSASLIRVAVGETDGTVKEVAKYVKEHYDFGTTSTRKMLLVACKKGEIMVKKEGKKYKYFV